MTQTKKPGRLLALVKDGWQNLITGYGTENDRTTATTYSRLTEETPETLENMFGGEWLARRIVQTLPEQALRKPPTTDVEGAFEAFQKLNAHELYPAGVFNHALYQGRLFGGAVLLIGFERGQPTDVAPEPGSASGVKWLDVVPWHDLTIKSRNADPNSERFRLPEIFRVVGDHPRKDLEFHASRAIFCEGLARGKPRPATDPTPWLSVLQPVLDTMRDYGVSWQGVSNLLVEASIGVVKLAGLIDMLAAKDTTAIQNRLQMLTVGRSAARSMFLDASHDESFTRTEVSFQALPQLMQQITQRMSGAAGVSATALFGQSPAGLNATGESDIRQDYDKAAVYREQSVKPKLQRLVSLIAKRPVELDFPSLWEESAQEKATTRLANAQADQIWYGMGGLDPIEVMVSRAQDGSLGVKIDPDAKLVAFEASQKEIPEGASIELTPSAQEFTTSANEVRAVNKLPPWEPGRGNKSVAELRAETEARLSQLTAPAPGPDATET
jgi:phage-related protein (TIGR01555 family)